MKFIPKYITTDILAEYGEHLTHEAYNEMVILNSTQGDYNTKILNQLFNTDEGIQIPYLDNKIKKVTDDQLAINEDMDQVVADMKALAGSLSKYTTICETRRMIQNATQGFVKTNKLKAGDNVDIVVDALNNVTISATGGVAIEYVDERDAATLSAANNYTDNAIAQIDLSDYATTQYVDDAIAHIDLDDYATKDYVDNAIADIPIPVVPTNVSAFTNDAGYITSHDIPPIVETDPYFSASPAAGIQATDITAWNNKSDFSGDYNDLTNKPTIPSIKTNYIHNDGEYLTVVLEDIHDRTILTGGNIYVKGKNTDTNTVSLGNFDYWEITPNYNDLSEGNVCIAAYRIDGTNGSDYYLGSLSSQVFVFKKDTTSSTGLTSGRFVRDHRILLSVLTTATKPTITKLWTFNTLPQSSVVPTNNDDLVNKAYVDGAIPTEIHYVKDSDLINSCFILKGKTKGIYLFTHAVGLLYDSTNTPSQTNPEVCRSGILWLNKDVDPSDTTGGIVGAMVSHAHSQNGETYVPSNCTMIITAPTMPSTMSGVVLSGGTGSPVNAVTPDVIAPNYSLQNTYNTGDLVTYNRKLYQCNSNNVTGLWNSSYWTQKTLVDLL